MTIELNHTIVSARDKEESVRFYERMFGFKYEGPMGHFAPLKIPSQSCTPVEVFGEKLCLHF